MSLRILYIYGIPRFIILGRSWCQSLVYQPIHNRTDGHRDRTIPEQTVVLSGCGWWTVLSERHRNFSRGNHVVHFTRCLSARMRNTSPQSVLFRILEVQDPEKRMEMLLDLYVEEGIRQSKTIRGKMEHYQLRRYEEMR